MSAQYFHRNRDQFICVSYESGCPPDTGDCFHEEIPPGFFLCKLCTAGCRKAVVFCPLVILGDVPSGCYKPLPHQTVKRRIQRSRFNIEKITGSEPNSLPDPVAVLRTPSQGLQDQHIERSLKKFSFPVLIFILCHIS
jgi:hypothetical protein